MRAVDSEVAGGSGMPDTPFVIFLLGVMDCELINMGIAYLSVVLGICRPGEVTLR